MFQDRIPEVDDSKVMEKHSNTESEIRFFILWSKWAFVNFKQDFSMALILNHFYLQNHILIKTDVSDYVINGIFGLLTLDDLSW